MNNGSKSSIIDTQTLPQPAEIALAAQQLAPYVRRTPVLALEAGELGAVPVQLKLESTQHSGSFKVRGAFYALLSEPTLPAQVIAASGGNHGAAVAYAARRLGIRAEIFVPRTAPAVKVARLHAYGAHVTLIGESYAEAFEASQRHAATQDALFVHAYDQLAVVTGQGTTALEFEQQADLDTVLVAVGGGGLISGVANWFQKRVKVIGVEPVNCSALTTALQVGHPTDVELRSVAADALGARRTGTIAFATARQWIDQMVLVDDQAILQAQAALWTSARVVAEPGGVTALAALLSGAYRPRPDERVGVLICGGNVDLQSVQTTERN